jgi:hypothetical protein
VILPFAFEQTALQKKAFTALGVKTRAVFPRAVTKKLRAKARSFFAMAQNRVIGQKESVESVSTPCDTRLLSAYIFLEPVRLSV